MERWKSIKHFPGYSVSDMGRIRADKSGRILSQSENQYGLLQIGLVRDGEQRHRSVPLLVAKAFLSRDHVPLPFDTPINKDGDRYNNCVENLAWRPRWFAIKYNQQFKFPYEYPILEQIINLDTGETFDNSLEAAKYYGLLEEDLVLSILNRTYAWPIYQAFSIL